MSATYNYSPNIFTQSYASGTQIDTSPFTVVVLAPYTTGAGNPYALGYGFGCLVALITSGQYQGWYVNYDPAGTLPGQQVVAGWLDNNNLPPLGTLLIPQPQVSPFQVQMVNSGPALIPQADLFATALDFSDVTPSAMAQIGAILITKNGVPFYSIG